MEPCLNYYTAGTDETPDYNTDIVTMSQGDKRYYGVHISISRELICFTHHQAEFTDLAGWDFLM
jgi:hypothetical protein